MIYAVDFDGTLCENQWPGIGAPNVPLIKFLKDEQDNGNTVILYTVREGELLDDAIDWLMTNHDFYPDEVNENARSVREMFGNNPRKVYADVYVDDHNARFGVCAELPYTGGNV